MFTEDECASVERFAQSRSEVSPSGAALVTAPPEVTRLEQLDWDFAEAQTTYLTHGLHPYPAKFIPQLPNALIQELSSVGDRIADTFCGSGTTLVEALLLKRHAIGIDANPLAALISRAKTTRLNDTDAEALRDLSRRASGFGSSIGLGDGTLLFEFAPPFESTAPRPTDQESLSFWFLPFVIEELAEIRAWCQALASEAAKTIALAAFSSIIVTVSKQDSDTRYTRRDKNTKPGDAFRRFAKALDEAIRGALEFTDMVEPRFKRDVVVADILQDPDVGEFDLLVTSPPYPNAYSYHLYHRSRMQWLDMDQPGFKKQEIGSHRKYSGKGANAASAETFALEMGQVFQWLRLHLKKGGYACFVVGDSTIRGETIDNASLLAHAAAPHGFEEVARLARQLKASSKSFNPAIGKIRSEQVLILRSSR